MCDNRKTMKSVLILFLVSVIFPLTSAKSGCIFNKYSEDPASEPVFIQKIGRQYLLLPVKTSGILILESTSMEIFCPHGFRKEHLTGYTRDQISAETKSVELTCTNGKIMRSYSDDDDNDNGKNIKFYELSSDDKFTCNKPAISIYESDHRMCTSTSYFLGIEYRQEPAILAEICYDLTAMKPIYLNYKATKRSPVISHQRDFSPVKFYPFGRGPIDIPSEAFSIPNEVLQDQIESKVGVVHGSVEYIFDQLLPESVFEPYYAHPLFAASFLGKTLWWKGLKMGNWRLFEEVLKVRSKEAAYDVVLGTSGTVVIPSSNPDCDVMKQFTFEVNSIRQSAPKFIWAYLKSDNYTLQEEFVVVAVNSPYLEFFSYYENMICRDICNSISWLAPLNKFRNISAFGKIYCCQIDEVKNKLEGMPDIYLKRYDEDYRNVQTEDYRDINEIESEEDDQEQGTKENSGEKKPSTGIFRGFFRK